MKNKPKKLYALLDQKTKKMAFNELPGVDYIYRNKELAYELSEIGYGPDLLVAEVEVKIVKVLKD